MNKLSLQNTNTIISTLVEIHKYLCFAIEKKSFKKDVSLLINFNILDKLLKLTRTPSDYQFIV